MGGNHSEPRCSNLDGGTIASNENADGSAVTADLNGHDLLASLLDRHQMPKIEIRKFASVNSFAMDLEIAYRLCCEIAEALSDPDTAGVVVTHGTDTMEETAYLSDLLVGSNKPVVFTGAQRHAGEADTDGPRNLRDAILCANDPSLRGYGSVIVFEGEVHAARDVSKTHTSRVDAFRSAGLGKLGEVDHGDVWMYRKPLQRCFIRTEKLEPRVEMALCGLGATPTFLDYCVQANVRGLVVSAFGRGNAPKGFAEAASRLIQQDIPVVVASRCSEGRTSPIYGGDSGGVTLENIGVLFAGTLSAVKARMLLSASLGAGASFNELATQFEMANRNTSPLLADSSE